MLLDVVINKREVELWNGFEFDYFSFFMLNCNLVLYHATRHKLIPTPQNFVSSTPWTTNYEHFFCFHSLSQVLDGINPLIQIVDGRKLSYLSPRGLTGWNANFRTRDIHPTQSLWVYSSNWHTLLSLSLFSKKVCLNYSIG